LYELSFDEVEDGETGLSLRREGLAIERLTLERREEALAERVVVGIADAAHRGPNAAAVTALPEGERCALTAQPWSE
jgi:hypothetical protein